MRKDILAVCILQYTDVTSLAVLCVTAATVFAHSSPTATTSMDLLANTFSYLKVSPIILVATATFDLFKIALSGYLLLCHL